MQEGDYLTNLQIQGLTNENIRLRKQNVELKKFAKAVVRYAGNSCDDFLADQARAVLEECESVENKP